MNPNVVARAILLAAILIVPKTVVLAKNPPAPQYINQAPLPGAGMALNSEGKPDGQGAMQVNIPIAYTPGDGFVDISAYAGQFISEDKSDPEWNNGTGTIGMGFAGWPRVYGSAMAVSSIVFHDSKCLSAQVQLVKESKNTPAFAIGAQDILDKESGDFASTCNTGVSYYGVATKNVNILNKNAYLTLGFGTARFLERPFGGISLPVNDYLSFATEYDGFQINTAIGWRPYGRDSLVTLLAGYNGQAGWLVGAHGNGKMNSLWAIPLTILFIRH